MYSRMMHHAVKNFLDKPDDEFLEEEEEVEPEEGPGEQPVVVQMNGRYYPFPRGYYYNCYRDRQLLAGLGAPEREDGESAFYWLRSHLPANIYGPLRIENVTGITIERIIDKWKHLPFVESFMKDTLTFALGLDGRSDVLLVKERLEIANMLPRYEKDKFRKLLLVHALVKWGEKFFFPWRTRNIGQRFSLVWR